MFLAARKRHLDYTGGKGHEQRVSLAVHLHADDPLVIHTVDAAPGLGAERQTDRQQKLSALTEHFQKPQSLSVDRCSKPHHSIFVCRA